MARGGLEVYSSEAMKEACLQQTIDIPDNMTVGALRAIALKTRSDLTIELKPRKGPGRVSMARKVTVTAQREAPQAEKPPKRRKLSKAGRAAVAANLVKARAARLRKLVAARKAKAEPKKPVVKSKLAKKAISKPKDKAKTKKLARPAAQAPETKPATA